MGLIGSLARYLLIVLAIWLLYRLLRRWMAWSSSPGRDSVRYRAVRPASEVLDVMVQDLQCGVYLPHHEALHVSIAEGERHFCSESCRDAYLAVRQGVQTGRRQ